MVRQTEVPAGSESPVWPSDHPPYPPIADLAAWRARSSWLAAAEHLSKHGLPAALSADLVPLARRRGLWVWASAA